MLVVFRFLDDSRIDNFRLFWVLFSPLDVYL